MDRDKLGPKNDLAAAGKVQSMLRTLENIVKG